jgi:hypothetical protein
MFPASLYHDLFCSENLPIPHSGLQSKFEKLWTLVGNTPMLEILYSYRGNVYTAYAKWEYYNLTVLLRKAGHPRWLNCKDKSKLCYFTFDVLHQTKAV